MRPAVVVRKAISGNQMGHDFSPRQNGLASSTSVSATVRRTAIGLFLVMVKAEVAVSGSPKIGLPGARKPLPAACGGVSHTRAPRQGCLRPFSALSRAVLGRGKMPLGIVQSIIGRCGDAI